MFTKRGGATTNGKSVTQFSSVDCAAVVVLRVSFCVDMPKVPEKGTANDAGSG